MKRLQNLFRQPEFQIMLFILGLILYNWPFLSIFHNHEPWAAFLYLFAVWTIAIAALTMVGRSSHEQPSNDESTNRQERK